MKLEGNTNQRRASRANDHNESPRHVEITEYRAGSRGLGRWVLLDYVDIVVHVQHSEEREFYALDRLWKDCPRIEFVDRDLAERAA